MFEENRPPEESPGLSREEELHLQQLTQVRLWHQKSTQTSPDDSVDSIVRPVLQPTQWDLTAGTVLHGWQERCVDAWFANSGRGVIKVVTGAGKTILALAIAERLQQTRVPDLRVVIVVPTVVLMNQWRDEVLGRSNLPPSAIQLLGGGHDGRLTDETRILICVLNSAATKLTKILESQQFGDRLLMIVDECHRAGAAEMRKVFELKRAYSLGLSATPEREDDAPDDEDLSSEGQTITTFDDTVLGKELGPVVFELNYADAIAQGVLPRFRVVHYGLKLNEKERQEYDKISNEIRDLRAELENSNRKGMALVRWCHSKAGRSNSKATRFLSLTRQRKHLLYRMSARAAAVRRIVSNVEAESSSSRGILFHESIEQVMAHFADLRKVGVRVVAEHSEFPDPVRSESLRLFREGIARVLVSARSLIEGFNVPAADFAIIVAASSSVRQRVQTLGRLLRKYQPERGVEKTPTLYVLYAADTVDEIIYEKADWDAFIGAEHNEYFAWPEIESGQPERRDSPPRRPKPTEDAIDVSSLQPGNEYPGDSNQGVELTMDLQGNVAEVDRGPIAPHPELLEILKSSIGGGRFRVTPRKWLVIKLAKTTSGWKGIYLGQLHSPVVLAVDDEAISTERLSPGDRYPLGKAKGKVFSVLQRDPRLIALKTAQGVRFVVPAHSLDEAKGKALSGVQTELSRMYSKGQRMSKIVVTSEGHVVCLFQNQAFFIGNAPEGPEGFLIEVKSRKDGTED